MVDDFEFSQQDYNLTTKIQKSAEINHLSEKQEVSAKVMSGSFRNSSASNEYKNGSAKRVIDDFSSLNMSKNEDT